LVRFDEIFRYQRDEREAKEREGKVLQGGKAAVWRISIVVGACTRKRKRAREEKRRKLKRVRRAFAVACC
jgi:hypothetical protein